VEVLFILSDGLFCYLGVFEVACYRAFFFWMSMSEGVLRVYTGVFTGNPRGCQGLRALVFVWGHLCFCFSPIRYPVLRVVLFVL